MFTNIGKRYEALPLVEKSLEIYPNNASALDTKDLILYNLGKYEESAKYYDKATDVDPYDANFWNRKGLTLDKLTKERKHKSVLRRQDSY